MRRTEDGQRERAGAGGAISKTQCRVVVSKMGRKEEGDSVVRGKGCYISQISCFMRLSFCDHANSYTKCFLEALLRGKDTPQMRRGARRAPGERERPKRRSGYEQKLVAWQTAVSNARCPQGVACLESREWAPGESGDSDQLAVQRY